MTKSQAKRLACRQVALLIDAEFAQDSDWLEQDEDGNPLSDADVTRLADALEELRKELKARGTEPRK